MPQKHYTNSQQNAALKLQLQNTLHKQPIYLTKHCHRTAPNLLTGTTKMQFSAAASLNRTLQNPLFGHAPTPPTTQ
ncbi:hypothetical protein Patl1_27551 [Pistacia atlantica]|uniref:Uncharacterized protein n=1 Tax=Pistacia atlantica TaxID=434234 RepID=A0ACC1BFW8_9ROSI|nr:hypothetical protein Patl1_27551 [Pistacia atlantica]